MLLKFNGTSSDDNDMKRAILIMLSPILFLNMVGLAWAGRGDPGIAVQLYMIVSFGILILLLVSSCCLIIKKTLEERRGRLTATAHNEDADRSSSEAQ